MKNLKEYLNESIELHNISIEESSADEKKLAKELLDEYSNFDDEDEDATKDLLERAINLILKASSLNKKDVDSVVAEYEGLDFDEPEDVEGCLEDVMNLISEIK